MSYINNSNQALNAFIKYSNSVHIYNESVREYKALVTNPANSKADNVLKQAQFIRKIQQMHEATSIAFRQAAENWNQLTQQGPLLGSSIKSDMSNTTNSITRQLMSIGAKVQYVDKTCKIAETAGIIQGVKELNELPLSDTYKQVLYQQLLTGKAAYTRDDLSIVYEITCQALSALQKMGRNSFKDHENMIRLTAIKRGVDRLLELIEKGECEVITKKQMVEIDEHVRALK